LSDIAKFPSNSIRGWLESETSSIFIPVHAKAKKLCDEMDGAIEDLRDACKMLLENSRKEIEKRNTKTYGRARALSKLARLFIERMQQIKFPDKLSYGSLQEFVQETQKTFVTTDADVRNWFPRISPFFILDRGKFLRVFEKAKESLKELSDFLAKEYVKTKTLEETFQLIDALKTLEGHLTNLGEQRKKLEDEEALIVDEIAEVQQKMAELKNKEGISQLNQMGIEIESLTTEVKNSLQHLQKPFVKLQSLTLHGGEGNLTPEELNKLNQYMENPFEALATEETGYPVLRQILQKLIRSISEGKLKLKPDKERKARQAVENILNENSLISLRQRCVDAMMRKKQLLTSVELTETKSELSKLQESVEKLERRRESIESEKNLLENAYNETLGKIQSHKNQIEKNIFDFTGKKICIE
jgi:hypothetical protein